LLGITNQYTKIMKALIFLLLNKGKQTLLLETTNFNAGYYLLELISESEHHTSPFVITK
jgi:hypothetical protein